MTSAVNYSVQLDIALTTVYRFVSEIQSIVCHIEECESRIDQLKLHRQHVESVLMEGRLMVEENVDLNR